MDVDDLPTEYEGPKFPKKKYRRLGNLSEEQKLALKANRELTKKTANAARFICQPLRTVR